MRLFLRQLVCLLGDHDYQPLYLSPLLLLYSSSPVREERCARCGKVRARRRDDRKRKSAGPPARQPANSNRNRNQKGTS